MKKKPNVFDPQNLSIEIDFIYENWVSLVHYKYPRFTFRYKRGSFNENQRIKIYDRDQDYYDAEGWANVMRLIGEFVISKNLQ